MSSFSIASLYASDLQRDSPQQLRERARQQGYLYFPGLLDLQPIAALREKVLQNCAELGLLAKPFDALRPAAAADAKGLAYDHPDYIELQGRVLASRECLALRESAQIGKVLAIVAAEKLSSGYGDVLRITFPDSEALTTQAHQERHYVRRCRALWVAWIPLLDCPLELGSLAIAAGSHQWGLLAHKRVAGAAEAAGRYAAEAPQNTVWHSAAMRCGDIVFFHGLALHRACPNLSPERIRLSVDFRYGF